MVETMVADWLVFPTLKATGNSVSAWEQVMAMHSPRLTKSRAGCIIITEDDLSAWCRLLKAGVSGEGKEMATLLIGFQEPHVIDCWNRGFQNGGPLRKHCHVTAVEWIQWVDDFRRRDLVLVRVALREQDTSVEGYKFWTPYSDGTRDRPASDENMRDMIEEGNSIPTLFGPALRPRGEAIQTFDNWATKISSVHHLMIGTTYASVSYIKHIWRVSGAFSCGEKEGDTDRGETWAGHREYHPLDQHLFQTLHSLEKRDSRKTTTYSQCFIKSTTRIFLSTMNWTMLLFLIVSEAQFRTVCAQDQTAPTDSAERKTAAGFLISVAIMQVVASAVWFIQAGAGRAGRIGFYLAFALSILHQLFAGIVVPGSLIWASWAVLSQSKSLDALLAAIVGTLWYGPDQVQFALQRMTWILVRYQILRAALGSYHRAAVHRGTHNKPLSSPLTFRRRLRFFPWWSHRERQSRTWWNGRLIKLNGIKNEDDVSLVDAELRTVARVGTTLALSGNVDEDSLRQWCVAMVADQARFPQSPLEATAPYEFPSYVFSGAEGVMLKDALFHNGKDWSEDDISRLATVVDGIRRGGMQYLREQKWLS
eukprot:Plantae.Rhodophyta-Hildenbrandia_rubra.ctg7368.p1 GENE.Plantae.Rhodophyta-Hildenbrandia_rubra.ctg7368~~Plantae.Rhodophyta-Hildenbrandia_rubra.ctg7368.p1  ORF type:complete len:619 (+),score=46.82 Plantae.Rhodophyta-Hildenbrandia_rubra.ctg7368:82-1857(+)